MRSPRRVRACVLFALAAVLACVAAPGLGAVIAADTGVRTSGELLAVVMMALAILAAGVGCGELLRSAPSRGLTVGAKIGAAMLLLVVSVIPVMLGVAQGPVAVAMAFLPVPLYLRLARRIDHSERAPRWLLTLTFLWGACVVASMMVIVNLTTVPVVEAAFGGDATDVYTGLICAPVAEESLKAAVLFIIFRRFRAQFNGVLDGILYATVVGLGFAASENIAYFGRALADGGATGAGVEFIVRGVVFPFGHPLCTAMTGIGLGVAGLSTKGSTRVLAPLLGLAGAMLLHSSVNADLILVTGVPAFTGVMVVIARTVRRERRAIERYLADDVEQGHLTPTEVRVLVSGRSRRRALKEATRAGGKDARRLRAAFHEAAGELALVRARLASGLSAGDAQSVEQHLRCQARVTELRARLGALAFLPAAAYAVSPRASVSSGMTITPS